MDVFIYKLLPTTTYTYLLLSSWFGIPTILCFRSDIGVHGKRWKRRIGGNRWWGGLGGVGESAEEEARAGHNFECARREEEGWQRQRERKGNWLSKLLLQYLSTTSLLWTSCLWCPQQFLLCHVTHKLQPERYFKPYIVVGGYHVLQGVW